MDVVAVAYYLDTANVLLETRRHHASAARTQPATARGKSRSVISIRFRTDVIATNFTSSTIGFRIGNGNGSFGSQTFFYVENPMARAWRPDVDGDLISPRRAEGESLAVLLLDWPFCRLSRRTIRPGEPYEVALGDLDSDGVLMRSSLIPEPIASIFMLGAGDGRSSAIASTPLSMTAGLHLSLDGDGHRRRGHQL